MNILTFASLARSLAALAMVATLLVLAAPAGAQSSTPPTITVNPPHHWELTEGDTTICALSWAGTYSDPDAGDTVTITASIGDVTKTGTNSGTWSWSLLGAGCEGPAHWEVTFTARDASGGTATASFQVTVHNAPPTAAGLTGFAQEGTIGQVTFQAPLWDPGIVDRNSLRFSYDFGNDGVFDIGDGTYAGSIRAFGTGIPVNFIPDGPGTLPVRGRIIDRDGGFTDYVIFVQVQSLGPSATFSAPEAVDEGQPFSLGLSNPSDPSPVDMAAGFQYAFDCGDGAGYGPYSDVTTASCTASDSGTLFVRGILKDKDNATGGYSAFVTVNNVAPTAIFNAPPSVLETEVILLSLTDVTDPSPVDMAAGFQYAFDCGDGAGYGPYSNLPSTSCPTADDGTLVVRGKVMDKDGGESEYTATVTVLNLPPTISGVSNDGPAGFGALVTITVDAADPAGAADPLTYSFDCDNDGVYEIGPQSESSAQCTFVSPGNHTVPVLVDDGDGGIATGTTVVTVLPPTIDDVVSAVDTAVASGTLTGTGPGRSDSGRLQAWRNMLKAAQIVLDRHRGPGSCQQLQEALRRADGEASPPDFVTGPARARLAAMLYYVLQDLGCPA